MNKHTHTQSAFETNLISVPALHNAHDTMMCFYLFHLNNQSITQSSNQAGMAWGARKVGAKKASE
jgi:hypothetical protein